MKYFNKTLYTVITVGLITIISCSKRLDLEPPIGLSSIDVYSDSSTNGTLPKRSMA